MDQEKEYEIPITWEMFATLKIKARSLDQAILKATDAELPEGTFVGASLQIEHELLQEKYPEECEYPEISDQEKTYGDLGD